MLMIAIIQHIFNYLHSSEPFSDAKHFVTAIVLHNFKFSIDLSFSY